MYNIILQINKDLVSESRCIRKLSMTRDDIKVYETKYEDLDKYKDLLLEGAIPVGSVEFTKYSMKLANINIPEFDCYIMDKYNKSRADYDFHKRTIEIYNKIAIKQGIFRFPIFIKPKETKLFTGFVYRGKLTGEYYDDGEKEDYSEHDKEQLEKYVKLSDETELYISDIINIKAEWRCYIKKGKLISVCQYDDSEEDLIPDSNFINKCIEKLGNSTLALDIGLLDNGEYVVIELNDAWAIGKYSGISDNDYFNFIVTRWEEIYETRTNR